MRNVPGTGGVPRKQRLPFTLGGPTPQRTYPRAPATLLTEPLSYGGGERLGSGSRFPAVAALYPFWTFSTAMFRAVSGA